MNTPPNRRNRIGIYFEVPGLKMNPLSALWRAGKMRSKVRRWLDRENLLWMEPLPAAAADEMLDAVNQVDQVQKKFHSCPGAKWAFALARNWMLEGMKNNSVQVLAYFNWFFILVDVSDTERGLAVIKLELEKLNLLARSEIAFFDHATERFRTVHPPGAVKPFELRWLLVKKLCDYGKNILKGITV